MKKFFKNIILLFLASIIIGEIVVRLTHAVSDIPQRRIDEFGIQKYIPNQVGYWKGGEHKWNVNKLGWPGELPENYDKLFVIIGDSYIENFMNPNECHQSVFLKNHMKGYNFLEAGRSGVSLIEAMEIAKQFEALNPMQNLIYVYDNDFYESIVEIKPLEDITQLSLKSKSLVYGKMKSPFFKKVLYNWKLLYYFYNRFPMNSIKKSKKKVINKSNNSNKSLVENKVFKLIDYIVDNYSIKDKVLVFHPNSNEELIKKCKTSGFKVIVLDSSLDSTWSFDHDSHWTCYGHKQAAMQVYKGILKNNLIEESE